MVPSRGDGLFEDVWWIKYLWLLVSHRVAAAVGLTPLDVLNLANRAFCVRYLLFTDYCIYWIHRSLHLPLFYKYLHKPHHKWLSTFFDSLPLWRQLNWVVPTPFASHAFHPMDGFLQSLPYHLFIFLFPIHRTLYLVLFVLVNIWSIFVSLVLLRSMPITSLSIDTHV